MSAGRNPNKFTAPTIKAPTPVTQYNFTSPTGDSYNTWRDGNSQYSNSDLSPQTQSTVQTSQDALQGIAQELAQPDFQSIAQQSQNFYDLQAQNINSESDNLYSKTSSDLSKRFGGTYTSTFGAMTLGQLQQNRLNQLYNAGKEATMFGQDLYNQNQSNQINRFQVFNNYLNNLYNQAESENNLGSSLLQSEAGRAQNLAIDQAQLIQQANKANQDAAFKASQQRLAILRSAVVLAGYAAAPVTGGASIAAGLAVSNAMK